MIEAALEHFDVAHRPYCSLRSLANLGGRKIPNEDAAQVVVTRTFINVVPTSPCRRWIRQMSAPGKLCGVMAEPGESDTFSSTSSTASGTHSVAPESDFAIASEDELQRQDMIRDNSGRLDDHRTLLDDVFKETVSNVFVRDFEKSDCHREDARSTRDSQYHTSLPTAREKSSDDMKSGQLTSIGNSMPASASSYLTSSGYSKSTSYFNSKNPFAHLRHGSASSDEESAKQAKAPEDCPNCISSVKKLPARETNLDGANHLSERPYPSGDSSPASPGVPSSRSKNAKRKLRLAAKAAAEIADAAALEEASRFARVEQAAIPCAQLPRSKKKHTKSKSASSNCGLATIHNNIESASCAMAASLRKEMKSADVIHGLTDMAYAKVSVTASIPALTAAESNVVSTATKSLSSTIAESSKASSHNVSGSAQNDMTNARLHVTPKPRMDVVVNDFDSKQRIEMKQTTLAVFRELKGIIHDSRPLDSIGEISHLQLAHFGPKSKRRLVSVYGDIFDVTCSPEKYGVGGELSWHTGKDVTWALITGSPKDVNGFYDVFKSGDLLQRYLRLLCSCITNCEREYGKPVGRLVEWREEQNLPAPLMETADCCLM